jgi:hypothetical protein
MHALFSGLERAHGSYELDGTTSTKGKKPGRALTLADPLTLALFERHLTSTWTLGVVPIRDDDTCVFAALDIDVYRGLDHRAVVADIQRARLPLVAVRSKSGGLHLYLLLREPAAAADVRQLLKRWGDGLGFPGVEIFPKQDALAPDETGNWLNMPYQGACVESGYGSERVGYDDTGTQIADVVTWLGYAEAKRVTLAECLALPVPVAEKPAPARTKAASVCTRAADPDSQFDGPVCLEHGMADKVGEGGRDQMLYQAAVYYCKKLGADNPDAVMSAVHKFNEQYLDPPLAFAAAQKCARQGLKEKNQFKCTDQPMAGMCDRAACLRRQFGIGGGLSLPNDGREVVRIAEGEQDEALAALRRQLATHPELNVLVYAGKLVRPYAKAAKTYGNRDIETLALAGITAAALAACLNRVTRFVRVGKKDKVIDCPESYARVLMDETYLWGEITRLDRMTETPIYADGQLFAGPGYDPTTRAWISACAGVALPEVCDESAARAALARLDAWLEEFPFDKPLDKDVAVAALMTAALRASTAHAPGILISKPSYGAGASTLGSLIGIVLTGRLPAVMTLAGGKEAGEETRKHIDAMQLAGAAGAFFDNLPRGRAFKSLALTVLLSEFMRNVRVLGQSTGVDVPCQQLVVCTGVNVTVGADLVRRFIHCRLDPRRPDPERRQFKRKHLLADAMRERASILSDCYTIVAAYQRSGIRVGGVELAGFSEWAELVQQSLLWLGRGDVVESAHGIAADDEEQSNHSELLGLWADAYADAAMHVRDVMAENIAFDSAAGKLRSMLMVRAHCDPGEPEHKIKQAVGIVLNGIKATPTDEGLYLTTVDAGEDRKKKRDAAKWKLAYLDGRKVMNLAQRLEQEDRERAQAKREADAQAAADTGKPPTATAEF